MIPRRVISHFHNEEWTSIALPLVPMLRVGMHRVGIGGMSTQSIRFTRSNDLTSAGIRVIKYEAMHSYAGAWEREFGDGTQ